MSVSKVAVVGTGMMGRGIVEVTATAGLAVKAVKATPGDLSGPRAKLEQSLDRRVKKGKIDQAKRDEILGRIEFTTDLDALDDAELVVESAIEDLDCKHTVLKAIEPKMNPEAVLGTNTSSLRLEKLAEVLERPERFVGLHFFSPVPAMKLVELASIDKTADFAMQRSNEYCTQIGKSAVQVKSSPGYVVNRLLVPYMLHGIETLESGIADAQSIDAAMQMGAGHPMGPLALADLIGLDVVSAMAETLHAELKDERYRMPALLQQLLEDKQLGRKTKLGLYDYSGDEPVLNPNIKL